MEHRRGRANQLAVFRLAPAVRWGLPLPNGMARQQVPLCSGARCPLGPVGLATPAQR